MKRGSREEKVSRRGEQTTNAMKKCGHETLGPANSRPPLLHSLALGELVQSSKNSGPVLERKSTGSGQDLPLMIN